MAVAAVTPIGRGVAARTAGARAAVAELASASFEVDAPIRQISARPVDILIYYSVVFAKIGTPVHHDNDP